MKPMLAATLGKNELPKFPVFASPKLDGIRCLILDGVAVSRSLKPIRNKTVQAWVAKHANLLDGLDGELICGPHDSDVFNRTTREVMSTEGGNTWTFWVFDHISMLPYCFRYQHAQSLLSQCPELRLKMSLVPMMVRDDEHALREYEQECLDEGYEGIMVRDIDGGYKYGRSTVKEGGLLKVKRFADAEAVVVGWEERLINNNEKVVNALGHSERSTHKAHLTPAGDLGSLKVVDVATQQEFHIGSGFTAAQRKDLWSNKEQLIGKLVCYKHFEQGVKDLPRFPIFKGFRHQEDVS